ncbi:hypothetical protein [Azohydromonas lata]|uniref:hypothetical protein n=1 Tax=Azohydromonas lata TaxID=45677 RepID=UPI0012F4BD41|nr:hypothetical protein [Azohydromonas lata]
MKLPLVETRLLWDGRVCIVRQDDVEVRLPWRPPVLSALVMEADYAPAVRVQDVRELGCCRRDMTAAEAAAVAAWMAMFIGAVRVQAQLVTGG